MATLSMKIDPTFTQKVVSILGERILDDQNPSKAVQFMKESFGIEDEKLIAEIATGRMVMIFFENGDGEIVARDEVSDSHAKLMGGLPKLISNDELKNEITIRIYNIMKEMQRIILNKDTLYDLNHIHNVYFYTNIHGYGDSKYDIAGTVTTRELIKMAYNPTDNDKELLSHLSKTSSAYEIVRFVRDIENILVSYNKYREVIKFLANTIYPDIEKDLDHMSHDFKNTNKYALTYYYFNEYIIDINDIYNFIGLSDDEMNKAVGEYISNKANHAIEDEFKKLLDSDKNNNGRKPGPVGITDKKWDAGWISPDGTVFAKCGSTAEFIHLELAEEIFDYYGYTKTDDVGGIDHSLEQMGFLKFHDSQLSFYGYELTIPHKITARQKDRVEDYMKMMGYPRVYNSLFHSKSMTIQEFVDADNDELENFFA